MSSQRLWRWSNIVHMLYKCFVLIGKVTGWATLWLVGGRIPFLFRKMQSWTCILFATPHRLYFITRSNRDSDYKFRSITSISVVTLLPLIITIVVFILFYQQINPLAAGAAYIRVFIFYIVRFTSNSSTRIIEFRGFLSEFSTNFHEILHTLFSFHVVTTLKVF